MKIKSKSTHDHTVETAFNQFDFISKYMEYFNLVTELKADNLNYIKQNADVRFDRNNQWT